MSCGGGRGQEEARTSRVWRALREGTPALNRFACVEASPRDPTRIAKQWCYWRQDQAGAAGDGWGRGGKEAVCRRFCYRVALCITAA